MILTSEINSFLFSMSWGIGEQIGWGNLERSKLPLVNTIPFLFIFFLLNFNIELIVLDVAKLRPKHENNV